MEMSHDGEMSSPPGITAMVPAHDKRHAAVALPPHRGQMPDGPRLSPHVPHYLWEPSPRRTGTVHRIQLPL